VAFFHRISHLEMEALILPLLVGQSLVAGILGRPLGMHQKGQ